MSIRPSLAAAIKDVAVRIAREAERYVGAQNKTPCASCTHARSAHCGCGMVCIDADRSCRCEGYVPKADE